MSLTEQMTTLARQAKAASRDLAKLTADQKNLCLREMARALRLNGPQIVAANALAPAWTLTATAPLQVQLPVYYSWEFRTSGGGDFASLARLLRIASPEFLIPQKHPYCAPGRAPRPPDFPSSNLGTSIVSTRLWPVAMPTRRHSA